MAATAYITSADMIAAMGPVIYQALNVPNASSISANAQLLDALEKANSRVDATIRTRYNPADVQDDASLKGCAVKIAVYELLSLRPDLYSLDAKERFDAAISYLRDIQKGAEKGGVDLTFPPENRNEALGAVASFKMNSAAVVGTRIGPTNESWFPNW